MSKPRISINKLGEYMQANAHRRRRIVTDAKHPKPYITTRYTDAKHAIKEYFKTNYDQTVIDRSIAQHEQKDATSEWQEQDQALSIELLEAVADGDFPDLSKYDVANFEGQTSKISISGVEVSVNPDLIIRGEKRNKKFAGGVKLYTSKTLPLGNEAGLYIATILHQFIETQVVVEQESAAIDFCLSVDLPAGAFVSAPKSFKRRMSHIEAACEEIALRWPSV